ncbi:MAG: hypothetical protein M3067_15485 [Chloroflexota bacterium]|nr:hypothetical protein [Chloroflexota bacterium]
MSAGAPDGARRPAALGGAGLAAHLGRVHWDLVFTWAAVATLVIAGLRAAHFVSTMPDLSASIGVDYQIYMSAARRWLAGEGFFFPFQLAGPYVIAGGEVLYPPVVLWLLVPFSFLPAVLWWLVPVALTLLAAREMRPRPWGVLVAAVILVLPIAQEPILWGNPVIWLVPAVAWGLLVGWPAAVVLVKPTLAPFVLAGLAHPRSLLVGLAGLAILCVPFGVQLWLDWLTALGNSGLPATYSIRQAGLLLIPVALYLSGRGSNDLAVLRARLAARRPG